MRPVSITTKVVSSNPANGEVYWIQHYVIQFVSDLWQVGGFLRVPRVSSVNKADHHDKTEILLKMVLNTTTLTLTHLINMTYMKIVFKIYFIW
jgi:hypothetical protein